MNKSNACSLKFERNWFKLEKEVSLQKDKLKKQGIAEKRKIKITLVIIPTTPSIKINTAKFIHFFSNKYFSIICFEDMNKSHKSNSEKRIANVP